MDTLSIEVVVIIGTYLSTKNLSHFAQTTVLLYSASRNLLIRRKKTWQRSKSKHRKQSRPIQPLYNTQNHDLVNYGGRSTRGRGENYAVRHFLHDRRSFKNAARFVSILMSKDQDIDMHDILIDADFITYPRRTIPENISIVIRDNGIVVRSYTHEESIDIIRAYLQL
jgi:hypothetical protein